MKMSLNSTSFRLFLITQYLLAMGLRLEAGDKRLASSGDDSEAPMARGRENESKRVGTKASPQRYNDGDRWPGMVWKS